MSVNFLHPSMFERNDLPVKPASADGRQGQFPAPRAGHHDIDWQAVRRAGRACCCSARPMVIAIMDPAPGRPHRTDLLLCLHHYRASRKGLAAAGAAVLDMAGRPVPDTAWPDVP